MFNGHLNQNDNCSYQNSQPQQQAYVPQITGNIAKWRLGRNKRKDSKRYVTKFFKSSPKKSSSAEQVPCSSKRVVTNRGKTSKFLSSTKVKSGGWTRSDKTNTVKTISMITKSKSMLKRSHNLLKFTNWLIRLDETPLIRTQSKSACRPGTLYSDVLIGATSLNFNEVKTQTPRRHVCQIAQRKLNRALLECSKNNLIEFLTEESDKTKMSIDFPALTPFSPMKSRDIVSSEALSSSSFNTTSSLDKSNLTNCDPLTSSIWSQSQCDFLKWPDVVNLCEYDYSKVIGSKAETNGNGNFQQQGQFSKLSCNAQHYPQNLKVKSRFKIDIPSWNFTEIDLGVNAFPRFEQQFDNETYLQAEKSAMIALNSGPNHNAPWRYFDQKCISFLPQFNDVNYLKLEKLATLALNLVLGNISQQEVTDMIEYFDKCNSTS